MATQTHPYLVISDGTTTCTIQDGSGGATNYPLVRDGWAPAIAGLRVSPLEGYTPYEDVTETFIIEINGASATAALANLATLTKLLDQAARWYRGENVTAVLLKVAPHGSTVSATATPLQAAILGGAVGGAGVRLSPRWDEVGRNYVIPDVQVSVLRRGLWLHTTTEANSPAAADNGELVTFTLTARDTKCPTKLQLTNFGSGHAAVITYYQGGFLLLGEPVGGSAPIEIETAESATATAFTSVAVTGARNSNVLRFTPTNTAERASGSVTTPAIPSTSRLVAIFINVTPSATVSFTVRAKVNSVLYNQFTPFATIPANSGSAPFWVFLGVVATIGAISDVKLYCTASAASSNLDIDTVVFADAEAVQIVSLRHPTSDELGALGSLGKVTGTAVLDHRLLSKPAPYFVNDTSVLPHTGDAVLCTAAASLYGLWLSTGGGSATPAGKYRQTDGSNAVLQNTWTATRSTAYLVPQ